MQNPYKKSPSDSLAKSRNDIERNPVSRKRPHPSTTSTASALIISASDKAGMDDVDRTRIDKIILRESGNSKYMQQQRRRDAKVNERIESYQKRIQQAKPSEYAITPQLDQRLRQWQNSMATRATCVVVDMDMFYMACELLDKQHLRDVPACVGRGMILTSNYAARKFGVRSAMPGWIGDKLVKELSDGRQRLIHVPSNFDLYKQKSQQVLQLLREFDPHLRSYSLDEAYLDLGPYLALYLQQKGYKDATHPNDMNHGHHSQIRQQLQEVITSNTILDYHHTLRAISYHTCRQALDEIVHFMRACVEQTTGGLTCSAGMAPTVALAKIASDRNKPNGQCFVDPSEVLEFVRPLPVRKIPGIGRVTEKILNACQVTTVQELWEQRGLVNWLFPSATSEFLLKASIGCMGEHGQGEEEDHEHQKGMSRERTFPSMDCWTTLHQKLQSIAELVSADMTRKQVWARTITVKVKLDTFDVYSRSKRLPRGIDLITMAAPLFAQIRDEHLASGKKTFSCRLLGIRCSNLDEDDSKAWTLDRFLCNKSKLKKQTICKNDFITESQSVSPLETPTHREKEAINSESIIHPSSEHSLLTQSPTISAQHEATFSGSRDTTLSPQQAIPTTTSNSTVQCPLCQRSFSAEDNAVLNQHLDTCLNGSTVREAIRETHKASWVAK